MLLNCQFICSRKDSTAVFPTTVRKSLFNLVLFIMKYSSHSTRLKTSLDVCSNQCVQSNLNATQLKLRQLSNRRVEGLEELQENEFQRTEIFNSERNKFEELNQHFLMMTTLQQKQVLENIQTSLVNFRQKRTRLSVEAIMQNYNRDNSKFNEILIWFSKYHEINNLKY